MKREATEHSGWSLTIGRAFGTPIRVHFTFLLLVIWFAVHSARAGHDATLSVAFLLATFACIVLHELGHVAVALRYGVRAREIVLYPFGGLARLDRVPLGLGELLIALGGPAVNVLLGAGLGWIWSVLDPRLVVPPQLLAPADLVAHLALVNAALAAFNLLPAFPMDGGRALRGLLALLLAPERATEIASTVGQALAVVFGLFGLLGGNYLLVFIALFVFIGAMQENQFQRQRAVVEGKTAGQAMITRFETLAPQDSLRAAAEHLLATHQQDFPVVDAWKRVVGVLPRGRLMQGLARQGCAAAVLDVMEREPPSVAAEDPLERALELLRARPGCPVLVLDGGTLRGMITLENLAEYIEVSRRRTPAEV